MAGIQAKALFEFVSGGPEELSFSADEILRVLQQDVGGGWWFAANSRGQEGLVPESYLEIIKVPQQPSRPQPPPKVVVQPALGPPRNQQSASHHYGKSSNTNQEEAYEEWDDDWDDDDDDDNNSTVDNRVNRPANDTNGNQGGVQRREKGQSGTVRITLNRFSQFNRTAVDSYLFETFNVSEEDKTAVIVMGSNGPVWQNIDHPFTCNITSPKKESKFHGMKTFIAYQLTPSFSNIQVSRRYKHFDWLQQRLADKYSVLAVPPLPEKQISGRFEDDFVNQRLRQLQLWVDRMCQHPVISKSDAFHHFLTCTDEKKWKGGKRKAEKEEYTGGKFFLTVKSPEHMLDARQSEAKIESFGKQLRSMEDSLRRLSEVAESNTKKHEGPFMKEYQKLGNAFLALGKSFAFDDRTVAQGLTRAIDHTAQTYNDIGVMFQMQPPNDMHYLLEGLHEYKGLLANFPEMLVLQKTAMTKVQEGAAKLSDSEQQRVQSRSDVITYTALAEIEHFNQSRVSDFKDYFKKYLGGQIEFYKQITERLEDALRQYDKA